MTPWQKKLHGDLTSYIGSRAARPTAEELAAATGRDPHIVSQEIGRMCRQGCVTVDPQPFPQRITPIHAELVRLSREAGPA